MWNFESQVGDGVTESTGPPPWIANKSGRGTMAAMAPPILLTVDDDPDVSRSLARDLRQRYGEDYRIRRAESGSRRPWKP